MRVFGLLAGNEPVDGAFGGRLDGVTNVLNQVKGWMESIFIGVLIIGALLLGIYAIYIAFKLGKAEDEGKRKEAKNHLIWAIVGVISATVLVVLVGAVFKVPSYRATLANDTVGNAVNDTILLVSYIVGIILNLGGLLAAVFAGYIAYRLITASDDGKRKQAKQQLIWTIVAVIGVYAIQGLMGWAFQAIATSTGNKISEVGGAVFWLMSKIGL